MNDRAAKTRGLIEDEASSPGHGGGLLHRVCAAATHALAASGAGISMMTEMGTRGVYAASDPLTDRMEELQFILGEGPCWDAFASRRPVLVPDLDSESPGRWPVYLPAARASGIRGGLLLPAADGCRTSRGARRLP